MGQLVRIVRNQSIQLIHCNEQNCYPIGAYLARITGLPVVVSVHFTMGKDFCDWAFGKRIPERIFFVSEGNLKNCIPAVRDIIPEQRWRVLNNGIDLEFFRPDASLRSAFRKAHGVGSDYLIGTACALRERKQIEHLIAVGAQLPSNVKICVAGGAIPEEANYAEHLLQEAKRQLGERLIITGHITDLRPFFNGLDLFVNTSREEACSISVLESMACGCPVVGYASKSVDTQILPGGGAITPQDDILTLSRAVSQWLRDPDLLAKARTGARSRVEEAFDIRAQSRMLLHEYREILQSV